MATALVRRPMAPSMMAPRPLAGGEGRAVAPYGTSDWRGRFAQLRRQVSVGERAREVGKIAVRSATVSASAYAVGLAQGRFGAQKVMGTFPVDLAAGFGLHVLALTDVARDFSPHLHAIADGALAAHFAAAGRGRGKEWRAKAGQPALVEGYGPSPEPLELTGMASLDEAQRTAIANEGV